MESVKLHEFVNNKNVQEHYSSNNHFDVVYQVKLFLVLTIGGIIIILGSLYIISEWRQRQPLDARRQHGNKKMLDGTGETCEHIISVESTKTDDEFFL